MVFNFDQLYVRRWFFIFLISAMLSATFVMLAALQSLSRARACGARGGRRTRLQVGLLEDHARKEHLREAASWVIMTNNEAFLAQPELTNANNPEVHPVPWREKKILWTDDRSNLFDVLKFPKPGESAGISR